MCSAYVVPSIAVFHQLVFLVAIASLGSSPSFQVDEAQYEAKHEHAHGRVLDRAQFFVFFFCLVNDNPVDLAGTTRLSPTIGPLGIAFK